MMQEFVEGIQNTTRRLLENVHTALPGEIIKYDPALGLVNVQPKGKYYTDGVAMDYPPVFGVPLVITAAADGTGVYFPIKPGDSVLLVIGEQNISEWLKGVGTTVGNQQFQLQNAIAIPGLQKIGLAAQNTANSSGAVVIQGSLNVTGAITSPTITDIYNKIAELEARD